MRGCVKEVKGRLEFAMEYKGKTAKDVRMRMDDVMAQRYVSRLTVSRYSSFEVSSFEGWGISDQTPAQQIYTEWAKRWLDKSQTRVYGEFSMS